MATKVTNGLDLSSQKIVNVADPTANQDAATKKFVDDHNWLSTDITDFAEAVDDQVNTLIVAGTGITKTYNDSAGTLTLAASSSGAASADIQVFTSSTNWNKPTGAKFVRAIAIGGGAGAASGFGTSGGYGGGGGALYWIDIPAAQLTDPVAVTVGLGGAGGAGGAGFKSGTPGGNSSFGSYVFAPGGSGTTAGTTLSPYNGGGGGAGGNVGGTFGSQALFAAGGGAGGSNTSIGAGRQGGAGWVARSTYTAGTGGGGTAGGGTGAGGAGTSRSGTGYGGDGGGSSGGINGGSSGNGGDGGVPGGGGGGAGGYTVASGSGGNGGRGEVIVITWF